MRHRNVVGAREIETACIREIDLACHICRCAESPGQEAVIGVARAVTRIIHPARTSISHGLIKFPICFQAVINGQVIERCRRSTNVYRCS